VELLARRPIVVALAGPNGAGKTTFYRTFLANSGLYFINAKVIAQHVGVDAYRAAQMAGVFRQQLFEQHVSFAFQTVFSDPVGDKLEFLKNAEILGYTVVLFFTGIGSPQISDERVAMRVSQGGHDVPPNKVVERYPRVMRNLQKALFEISNVRVCDNSDLSDPYRLVALREDRGTVESFKPIPDWLSPLL
jgi:predicted ABC-type ATPase